MTEQSQTTHNFRIILSPDRLRVEFRKKGPLSKIGVSVLVTTVLLVIPVIGIVQHRSVFAAWEMVAMGMACTVTMLWFPVRDLLRKPVVFDRLHNRVTVGGRLLCDLTAIRRVDRHHSFPGWRRGKMRKEVLELVTDSESPVCFVAGFGFSVEEIRLVGRQVSTFAQAEFRDDEPPDRTLWVSLPRGLAQIPDGGVNN